MKEEKKRRERREGGRERERRERGKGGKEEGRKGGRKKGREVCLLETIELDLTRKTEINIF